jgi:hypothetical protein
MKSYCRDPVIEGNKEYSKYVFTIKWYNIHTLHFGSKL